MIRRIFLMMLTLSSFFVSQSWAGDCTQFISDFKEGKIISSKAYQFESEQLYLPDAYCPLSLINFVSNQNNRVEFYLVEQCRETHYKILKTSLMCVQDPKVAKVRSICDVDGHLFSPCLKNQLEEALMQPVPA